MVQGYPHRMRLYKDDLKPLKNDFPKIKLRVLLEYGIYMAYLMNERSVFFQGIMNEEFQVLSFVGNTI